MISKTKTVLENFCDMKQTLSDYGDDYGDSVSVIDEWCWDEWDFDWHGCLNYLTQFCPDIKSWPPVDFKRFLSTIKITLLNPYNGTHDFSPLENISLSHIFFTNDDTAIPNLMLDTAKLSFTYCDN